MTFSRRIEQLLVAGVVAGIVACGDANPTQTPPPPIADRLSITLTPESDSIQFGATRLFTARVTNQFGVERTVPVDWASSNTAVATVGPTGLATAVSAGSVQLIASITGHADTALVTVYGEPVAIQIVPDAVNLLVGDDIQLLATTGDEVAGAGESVIWTTSDSTLATVATDGTVTGHEEGLVTLTAQIGSAKAEASVVVQAAPVATITLTPAVNSIVAGATVELEAIARSATGKIIRDVKFQWLSSDTSVATVNGGGLVRGRARGFSIISASAQGKRGSVSVNVGPAAVARVVATVPDSSLVEGQVVQATATAYDASNQPIIGATVAWQSSNPAIATVTSSGRVTMIVAGAVNIMALSGGKTGSVPITGSSRSPVSVSITPAAPSVAVNGTAQLTARVLDQNGQPIAGLPVAWSVSNSSIAGITQGGLLTGKVQGSVSITATSGTLSKTVQATVGLNAVATVTVSPGAANVVAGDSAIFVATTLDAQGVPLPGRVVTWTSANTTVATIDAAGVATAIVPGTSTITATSEGKSASATLTVLASNPLPVATIGVTLNSTTLNVGQQTAAVATARNTAGTVITVPISWSSSDPAIATVSTAGLVTAITGGTTTIVAASGGVKGAASLTITAGPPAAVASILVNLTPNALAIAGAAQAQVTLLDVAGNVLTGRTIGFSSDKPVVATVSAQGAVSAIGTGLTNIRAAAGGKSGFALLTVSSSSTTVASVSVTASAVTLSVGSSLTATATAYDVSGNPVGGRTFTWVSSAPSIISVSPTGVLTAIAAGSASITASTGGVSGSLGFTALVLNTNPVASVSLSLNASTVTVGQTTQGVTVLKDALGATLSGRPIAYSSSNTAVATVSTAGLVSALSAGSATITATSGGVSGSASLTTVLVPVTSVAVTVTPSMLSLGQNAGSTVTLRDAQGNILVGRPITYTSNNSTVASVNTAGVVTALAVGAATITATSGGVSGTAGVTVQASAPPASSAALPRTAPSVPAGLASLPCTVNVPAGGLQSALNAARGGAVLCLAPASRHVGRFYIPARVAGNTGWIVLRTSTTVALGAGRIRPSQAGQLAKIVSPNTLAALDVVAYSRWVMVLGVEITSDSALTTGPNQLVTIGGFGGQGGSETSVTQLPTDIVFDRVYVHGWAHQNVRRAFGANGAAQTFVRSWCEEIHQFNADSQCIAAWNSPGPILIEDNHLSASSENITFGGSDPTIPGVFARDVTVRGNHLYKPDSWRGKNWNIKNLIESKASQRVLVENNVFDGNWFDAAPGHAAVVLKSTNPNGGCRECFTSDWTIRRNRFSRIGVWLSLAGRADATVGAPQSDSSNKRIAILENWADSISVAPYTNQNRPNIMFGSDNRDVWLERNTVAGAGPTLESALAFDLSGPIKIPVVNLSMKDNVLPKGIYGMGASSVGEGLSAWNAGALGVSVWSNNAFLGKSTAAYPAGTTWHTNSTSGLSVAGIARSVVDAGLTGVVVSR